VSGLHIYFKTNRCIFKRSLKYHVSFDGNVVAISTIYNKV